MYYPYLRARQFELIALRELAEESLIDKYICPVIEPVRALKNNLKLANDKFFSLEWKPFLILNPAVGDSVGDIDFFCNFINELDENSYRPAFLYRDNARYIETCIDMYSYSNVLIIGLEDYTDESNFIRLINKTAVSTIMLLNPLMHRQLNRQIKNTGKEYIRLDNLFETKNRNSDYLDTPPHKFSEEHLYYRDDDFQGYSDFTLLPMQYDENGFLPRAVVIHWSYLNHDRNNEIWVRHFTSENNFGTTNIQGKFQEAAMKAVGFITSGSITNSAARELLAYVTESRYPSLGTIKKLSIKNHILTNFNYLKHNNGNG